MSGNVENKWNAEWPVFKLTEKAVHLWSVPLDIDHETQVKYWRLLGEDEKSKANRFKFRSDHIKYIACRGALRILLGQYLRIEAKKVEINYLKNGKPNHNSNLEFNVSHSEDWAVIGFALDTILGVDIEYIRRVIEFEDIARRFFSKEESKLVLNAPRNEIPLYFYSCWTRKEAFIKALGDGLSFPLDQFEVSCKPGTMPQLLKTNWNPAEVEKWSLWSFQRDEAYTGAIALRGPKKIISYYTWDHKRDA
jgi:4'-phosphopantetheinyl transferase